MIIQNTKPKMSELSAKLHTHKYSLHLPRFQGSTRQFAGYEVVEDTIPLLPPSKLTPALKKTTLKMQIL